MTEQGRLTVAAALASAAAAFCLVQLTQRHDWLLVSLAGIALVAGTGALARRTPLPAASVAVVQIAVVLGWLAVQYGRDGDPATDTVPLLWARATAGVAAAQRYAAPVPDEVGILLLLVAGTAAVAVLVDLLAAGWRRPGLAGLPLVAAYAVPAAVLPDGLAWPLFVLLGGAWLGLLAVDGRARVARWGRSIAVTSRGVDLAETSALSRAGRRVAVLSLGAAVAVPALMPGLADGVLGTGDRGGGSGGGRVIHTDNPIVDLKRDLTRPENIELLRYRTNAPSREYIRTVTLDVFDGSLWRPSPRKVPSSHRVDEDLPDPPGLASSTPRQEATTTVEVGRGFRSRWLPMPYPARSVEIDGDWRYDTATLDVVSVDEDTRGLGYTVRHVVVHPSPESLAAAGGVPAELAALTQVPDDLPVRVRTLASEVTADAEDAWARAAALQRWFRSEGGFVYDIAARPGNSADALVTFLGERRGYCEQFAATMAIMARYVGIPARVAVGFLPGEQLDDGSWLVGAHDAHAWPELYFAGAGWVRFEPTPAARTGGAPDWTQPRSSDDSGIPSPSAVPSAAAPGAGGGVTSGDLLEDIPEPAVPSGADAASTRWLTGTAVAVLATLLALLVPGVAARVVRGIRWRRAARDPAAQAEAAWADLRDAVRDAGLTWAPAETPRATAARVAEEAELGEDARARLGRLVTATEQARYAPHPALVEGLRDDVETLRTALRSGGSGLRRLRSTAWPSVTADLVADTGERLSNGLDRVDGAGERVAARAGGLLRSLRR